MARSPAISAEAVQQDGGSRRCRGVQCDPSVSCRVYFMLLRQETSRARQLVAGGTSCAGIP